MGCGCHSAKKSQPIRSTVKKVVQNTNTEPIIRQMYKTNGLTKKRIIRRTISH